MLCLNTQCYCISGMTAWIKDTAISVYLQYYCLLPQPVCNIWPVFYAALVLYYSCCAQQRWSICQTASVGECYPPVYIRDAVLLRILPNMGAISPVIYCKATAFIPHAAFLRSAVLMHCWGIILTWLQYLAWHTAGSTSPRNRKVLRRLWKKGQKCMNDSSVTFFPAWNSLVGKRKTYFLKVERYTHTPGHSFIHSFNHHIVVRSEWVSTGAGKSKS